MATQTDKTPPTSNLGQGRNPIDENKHAPLFEFDNETAPNYCLNLSRVFGEEFLAEATLKDKNLQTIIRLVKNHNWEQLKLVSRYYYNLGNDLAVVRSGCLLYDGKLVIPHQLQNLVINAVHRTHPGQEGMIRLANLIWFPQIHRTIALRAENCKQCLDQGKNLKPIITKSELGTLPKLSEPNEELQIDFAGTIVDTKINNNEHYILAAVDRFSRYPSALVHTNCDSQTAIEFLNQYCKFHGIPRSIRCDQAQAFKSRAFEIYCKEKNIKLIFSPTHDHRASGMVERLIQTLKPRLATMNIDPIWDNTTIAEKITEIIESIRLIPNRITKIPPFQAHFGRQKNTELSNILTTPSTKNLSYNNIKTFYLDKRLLQNPSLTPAAIWDRDTYSEKNLDIQYRQDDQTHQESQSEESQVSDTSESDNAPLLPSQKGTIIPSKFKFQIGDKTTIIDQTRRNLARKALRRKNPEPRGTLKLLWSIIPDGTIVDYSPHTITIDTNNRKNTVIRNNDIAISSETRPLPQVPKIRLINFVACKTVGEYNRNKRKIEKFCLAEKAQLAKTSLMGQSSKNSAQQGQPNIQQTRKRKATTEETRPPAKTQQQEMSTPIDDEHATNTMPNSSINVSPIFTKTTGGKKKLKKKSPGTTQQGKRTCIRKKATVSAARRTANTKLTKAKLAALKQSYAFQLSQSPVNFNELSKKPTARVFKERSPGHAKPFIIATSSSAADFLLTPKRSTVSTIARSPPMRNIRKSKAEATVKRLNVEKSIANISLSPTTDDSTQELKRKDTTIIDLLDTSDDSPPQVALSINPNCTTFGQDIIILSSDSQDSFHTASVNSAPTRKAQPSEPMDWTPDPLEPERDTNTQNTAINGANENTSNGL